MNAAVQQALDNINTYIVTNGNQEITAAILNPILEEIINSLYAITGDDGDLDTAAKTNLVAAINELKNQIDSVNPIELYTGGDDPNVTPPNGGDFGLLDQYQQTSVGGAVARWVNTGIPGIGWLNLTALGTMDTPTAVNLDNEQVYNFPALQKGEGRVLRISGTPSGGYVWLGGMSGAKAGTETLIVALQDTAGGNWATARSHFYISNTYSEAVLSNSKITKKKQFTYTSPNNTFDLAETDLDEVLMVIIEGASFCNDGTDYTIDNSEVTVNSDLLLDGQTLTIIYNINVTL